MSETKLPVPTAARTPPLRRWLFKSGYRLAGLHLAMCLVFSLIWNTGSAQFGAGGRLDLFTTVRMTLLLLLFFWPWPWMVYWLVRHGKSHMGGSQGSR